uniref:Uncharacterized protein n=1 Tax=Timema bartmani TaxID=61472 RepID=A0A7R9FDX5_9NEOP|nr:unnamed protein product [Timema bartmani]
MGDDTHTLESAQTERAWGDSNIHYRQVKKIEPEMEVNPLEYVSVVIKSESAENDNPDSPCGSSSANQDLEHLKEDRGSNPDRVCVGPTQVSDKFPTNYPILDSVANSPCNRFGGSMV